MTIQVDDQHLRSAEPAAAAPAVGAIRSFRPVTGVHLDRSPVPVFDVIAEPVTGRLDLAGEFDIAGGQRFRDASDAILAGGAAEVVVDLTRLRFIDASGIGRLIELRNELATHEGTLRIINADARIGRVFVICGLDAMLTASDTPSAADH